MAREVNPIVNAFENVEEFAFGHPLLNHCAELLHAFGRRLRFASA
jgi:hypothetical protein